MKNPILEVDLKIIYDNACKLKNMLDQEKVEIMYISKGNCANQEIIQTILKAGITKFGDSRIENIIDVKKEFKNLHYTLIRIPRMSELEEVLKYTDCSLQSELEVIKKTSDLAIKKNKVHDIILMIDVGDLREGVLVEDAFNTIKEVLTYQGVRLLGIGTNVGCYGSIKPSIENTEILVKIKDDVKTRLNYEMEIICGGSTCTTDLFFKKNLHSDINLLRIGEAILFGEDSTNDKKIDLLDDGAFVIKAEIIELKTKPSYPIGEIGKDAFGVSNEYQDIGNIKRAIIALGKQDVTIYALTSLDNDIYILGGSSDHIIVDVTNSKNKYRLGDLLSFKCSYSAVLMATTSKYVNVVIKK